METKTDTVKHVNIKIT